MLGQLFYFYSLAALYLQHTQHLGTKTTPDTQFSQVKAIHKTNIIWNRYKGCWFTNSLCAGVGERTREGNDLYYEMQDSSIISRTDLPSFPRKNIFYTSTQVHSVNTNSLVALVFGQMNETPGARMRVSHVSLTMAEYFRDALHQDVLIFIDNVFQIPTSWFRSKYLIGKNAISSWLSAHSLYRNGFYPRKNSCH